ncbi:hypothetical protein VKT23_002823 [Stygiomarasmius scandens]|uniref:F-box domain-containing protein n=1 Tax=Marasmiellus scandens TaxID=2682957 RepID=A0ABR1JW55_9AGAR
MLRMPHMPPQKLRKLALNASEEASSSTCSFPPELIMLVIQHLSDSVPSLKNCALVCRTWRYPAQCFLFRSLSLYDGDTCNKLNRAFRGSPALATHVRKVVISRRRSSSKPFIHLRNATNIIERLRGVRTLSIASFCNLTSEELDNLAKLQTVETLRLQDESNFTAIPFLWKAYPNLHTFQLLQTPYNFLHVTESLDGLVLSETKTLRALALSNIESPSRAPIARFFTRPEIDYSGLQSLKLLWGEGMQTSGKHLDLLDALLHKCGFHVQNLTLVLPRWPTSMQVDLLTDFLSVNIKKHFRSTKNLVLMVYLDKALCCTHKITTTVLSLLNSSATHLRFLTLDIFLEFSESSPSSDIRNSPGWETLDALFSNASNGLPDFAKLEMRISIVLEDGYIRYNDLSELGQKEIENIVQTELTDLFKLCLPATNRAGRLFITLRTIRPAPWAHLYDRWDVKAGTVPPGCIQNRLTDSYRIAPASIFTDMPTISEAFRSVQDD